MLNTKNLKIALHILVIIILILSFVLIEKNKQLKLLEKINNASTRLSNDILEMNELDLKLLEVKNLDTTSPIVPKEKNEEEKTMPEKYGAEIIQIGGPGSHYISKKAYKLDEHGYLMGPYWIDYSFNNTYDLLHVACGYGYKITKCHIDGEETTFYGNECSMEIKYQIQNKINIVCEKEIEDN